VITLWDVQEGRWWPLSPVLFTLGGVALTVLLGIMTRLNPWSLLAALVIPFGFTTVREARARVRLLPDGVEVRGLRTRLFRYADITSVQVAPEWDGARAVWIRLRGSVPQAAPEVLAPPPEWWQTSDRSLQDVVALIQERVDAANGPNPAPGTSS
jgi:hypothetical protein